METVKYNKITLNIPTSWSDITLERFVALKEHEKMNGKMDYIDYSLGYISIVTGISLEELDYLTPIEYNTLLNELLGITKSEIKPLDNPTYVIDGQTYMLDSDISKISLGQYSDLDDILKEGDLWDVAHKITASFYRKANAPKESGIKAKYNKLMKKSIPMDKYVIEDYDYTRLLETSEVFLYKLPMDVVYSIVVFFLTIVKTLQKIIKDSSLLAEENPGT